MNGPQPGSDLHQRPTSAGFDPNPLIFLSISSAPARQAEHSASAAEPLR